MSKRTKRIALILMAYLLVIVSVYFASSTLTKYVSRNPSTGDYNIGAHLFVNYERGQLYRNGQLIVGVEIDEGENGADGIPAVNRRIETMNVAPRDLLVYHFYVSNYDEKTTKDATGKDVIVKDGDGNPIIADQNGVNGQFHVTSTAILSMPAHGSSYNLNCTLTYRKVNGDGTFGEWQDFPFDTDVDLPVFTSQEILYEFQVYVLLDDQVQTTSHDDYVGATLSILIFVDAADKM